MSKRYEPTAFSARPQTIIAGAIGNAIEFYDFIVYAYLATYFAKQFFPSTDPIAALIASYGAFASGMLMRPIGGILLGTIGDRIGRKMALQISVLLIAIPTLLIGLMPTYATIGIWAPIFLIVLRMMQGLSVGGEYSSSIVFLVERSDPHRRGFIGSFSPLGAFGGLLLGTAVSLLCFTFVSPQTMSDWGWRVPFIASVFLTLIGVIVRAKIGDDSQSALMNPGHSPVKLAFGMYWREMLAIALANAVTGIVSFVGFMFAVQWMVEQTKVSNLLALSINIFGLFSVAILSVCGGALGDYFGRMKIAKLGVWILFLGAWPAFILFGSGYIPAMLLGTFILALGQGFFVGPMCANMAALLPKKVRVTGLSFGYSLSVGIFGGFAPMLTEYLIGRKGIIMAPAIVIMLGAIVSLLSLHLSKYWRHSEMTDME